LLVLKGACPEGQEIQAFQEGKTMITLHVVTTLLLFLPFWLLTDPMLRTENAMLKSVHMLGVFFMSGTLVTQLAGHLTS
jgi:hypothetical protein